MGDQSDSETGQIVGVSLVGPSVTKLHIMRRMESDSF
jgi:hypothetical protein